jgi:hypothetical protein
MSSIICVYDEDGIWMGFDYIDYRIFYTDREIRMMKLKKLNEIIK